ncbi:MAG: single-stranded-DNA-specific exonuclease RecJ [Ignavibacteriaceae bacterium]|nr:single-stranded-DNA-specific exonuclease RecJ [Ignavibacteriaceae bacterium]
MYINRWKITEINDDLDVRSLADSLNISESLAKILYLRGVDNLFRARQFLRPSLNNLHDPFLMDGMDTAARRVIMAITGGEKIMIYGDYDVDGTCATSIIYMFLRELYAKVDYYIPHRLNDGYGITKSGIDQIKATGATLMIAVDCGTTAYEETAYANSLGLDVIIADHHQPGPKIPEAFAMLNPLKPGCNYPFKYLSGAGVSFKLVQAIAHLIGKDSMPMKYLDLVALAGAADIVPLEDENRVLVKSGLELISQNPRPGLKALLKTTRLDHGNLSSGQVVFSIAPRINAVGRLSDAKIAVKLLCLPKDADKEAEELAAKLESDNNARKKIDEETLTDAIRIIENDFDLIANNAIVLYEDCWHPGVIGIVASRLVDKYSRPAVLLTVKDGIAKGSARSTSNFNIYAALQSCSDILIHFGGHQAAAGLAIETSNIPQFIKRLNKFIAETDTFDFANQYLEVDTKIKLSEITPKFLKYLQLFAPFGPANPRPVFMAEDVTLASYPKVVGTNHILFSVRQNCTDKVFDCIGFDLGEFEEALRDRDKKIDIVFSIDHHTKDQKTYPQFRVRDIYIKD